MAESLGLLNYIEEHIAEKQAGIFSSQRELLSRVNIMQQHELIHYLADFAKARYQGNTSEALRYQMCCYIVHKCEQMAESLETPEITASSSDVLVFQNCLRLLPLLLCVYHPLKSSPVDCIDSLYINKCVSEILIAKNINKHL